MPIPLPNLDDRSYADLTAQARSLLPSLDPAWTNHNPSDPGIVLVELLAWLTEMLLFQVNELAATNTEKFLQLLNGPGWSRPETTSLDDATRQTMLDLRERYRAVTPSDYERLALHAWPATAAAGQAAGGGRLRRVRCIPRRDLSTDPAVHLAEAPGHVSLVVLPEPPAPSAEDAEALRAALWSFLDERRTLTTHHHVVAPELVPVRVAANLAVHEDAPPDAAIQAARDTLTTWLDPLTGGTDGTGWPFGRAVFASEASAVLEAVELVDYVEEVQVGSPAEPARVRTDERGRGIAVELDAHELVTLESAPLVPYDVHRRRYQ